MLARTQWVQDETARRILHGTSHTEESKTNDTVMSVEKHGTESVVDQEEAGEMMSQQRRAMPNGVSCRRALVHGTRASLIEKL